MMQTAAPQISPEMPGGRSDNPAQTGLGADSPALIPPQSSPVARASQNMPNIHSGAAQTTLLTPGSRRHIGGYL